MYLEIKSTVTTKVPITDDGLGTPVHAVEVDGMQAEGLPIDYIYGIAWAGLKSSMNAIEAKSSVVADLAQRKAECPFDCDYCSQED